MLIRTVLLWINGNLLSETGKFLFVYKGFNNIVDACEIFGCRWAVSSQTHEWLFGFKFKNGVCAVPHLLLWYLAMTAYYFDEVTYASYLYYTNQCVWTILDTVFTNLLCDLLQETNFAQFKFVLYVQ